MAREIKEKYDANEFLTQLEILLSIRVNEYHRKHKKDFEFINELIICPRVDDYDSDFIKYPANTREHFEKNIGIDIVGFELASVGLNENKELVYCFFIYPYNLDEDCVEYLEVELIKSQMTLLNDDVRDYLGTISEDIYKKAITEIKRAISFDTLKRT